MEQLDRDVCYRAIQSRDARMDGRLFIGVTSSGVYCRPICPARTPRLENCRFFSTAAAAQDAGFRPCLRCRPETAPGLAAWRGTSNTVARALALIDAGALNDHESLPAFAARLGLGGRQLRRLFEQHIGVSPVTVAQTRRILLAKQLIHETTLPMAEVALAAGFGSIRRFNETFQNLYHRPPSTLRKRSSNTADDPATIKLQLHYRPPYHWPAMLHFLAARAIPGVEVIEGETYRRTVAIHGAFGVVSVAHRPACASLEVAIQFPDLRALPLIVAQTRHLFDLDADSETIARHLSQDTLLAPIVTQLPGLRLPGCWDGFELSIRAILGQQVSIVAARKLAGELVTHHGTSLPSRQRRHPALTHIFPTPQQIVSAPSLQLRMPRARLATLLTFAQAALADHDLLHPFSALDEATARLRSIRGVGDWTAQYIAMRALGATDAFPASDVGLLRAVGILEGTRPSTSQLLQRAHFWRPWRAYAAQYLWSSLAEITR